MVNRKRVFFLITLFSLSFVNNAYCDDRDKEIALNKIIPTTRSISNMPEASIDTHIKMLSVSMDDSGMYTLYIENSLGDVLYQSVLPANGLEYHYDLSGIGEGYFRLVLEGARGEA